jgi:hypothetical protein
LAISTCPLSCLTGTSGGRDAGDLGALPLTDDLTGVLSPDWRSTIGAEDADRPDGDEVARPVVAAAPPAATNLPLDPPLLRANDETIAAAAAIVPTPARIARFRRTCPRRPLPAERAGADALVTGRPGAGLLAAGLGAVALEVADVAAAGLGAADLAAAGLGAAGLAAAGLAEAGLAGA